MMTDLPTSTIIATLAVCIALLTYQWRLIRRVPCKRALQRHPATTHVAIGCFEYDATIKEHQRFKQHTQVELPNGKTHFVVLPGKAAYSSVTAATAVTQVPPDYDVQHTSPNEWVMEGRLDPLRSDSTVGRYVIQGSFIDPFDLSQFNVQPWHKQLSGEVVLAALGAQAHT